jgi:hypothetical protein
MSSGARKNCSNGGGGKSEELLNSKNATLPLIKLPGEEMWAETWCKERKQQHTNGQENYKITALPTSNGQLLVTSHTE